MTEFFVATDRWRSTYPGSVAGLMRIDAVANPSAHPDLETAKRELERDLLALMVDSTKAELRVRGTFPVYDAYYRRFGQQYHVAMQLESVVLKNKPIPTRAALVEAMFMAELATGILSAAHDADAVAFPVAIDVATGDERYVRYDGVEERCKPDDMLMRDANGALLTSMIQGPTTHALVTPLTDRVVFAVYAPSGIGAQAVVEHLSLIETYVRLVSPNASPAEVSLIEAA